MRPISTSFLGLGMGLRPMFNLSRATCPTHKTPEAPSAPAAISRGLPGRHAATLRSQPHRPQPRGAAPASLRPSPRA